MEELFDVRLQRVSRRPIVHARRGHVVPTFHLRGRCVHITESGAEPREIARNRRPRDAASRLKYDAAIRLLTLPCSQTKRTCAADGSSARTAVHAIRNVRSAAVVLMHVLQSADPPAPSSHCA